MPSPTHNVVELSGAVLLLLGLRFDLLTVIGAGLLASSMIGATLAHLQAGNLFAEVPWTLVIFGFCLIVVLLHWPTIQAAWNSVQGADILKEYLPTDAGKRGVRRHLS